MAELPHNNLKTTQAGNGHGHGQAKGR